MNPNTSPRPLGCLDDSERYVGGENKTGMPGRDEHNDGGLDAGDMHEAEQAGERAAGETGEPKGPAVEWDAGGEGWTP